MQLVLFLSQSDTRSVAQKASGIPQLLPACFLSPWAAVSDASFQPDGGRACKSMQVASLAATLLQSLKCILNIFLDRLVFLFFKFNTLWRNSLSLINNAERHWFYYLYATLPWTSQKCLPEVLNIYENMINPILARRRWGSSFHCVAACGFTPAGFKTHFFVAAAVRYCRVSGRSSD